MSEDTIVQEAAPERAIDAYDSENVKVLKDAAHIRLRPGMYIGDTGTRGLHHLVYELVYNSVDEALAGHCHNIHITIDVDGSCSCEDDGRGIPVDIHPETGKSTLELVLTTVGAGAKFDKSAYKTSAGLHGMGAKAVTALSSWCEATVQRNGKVYQQEYERGKVITQVRDLNLPSKRTGTTIKFLPDPEIFHDATFKFETLQNRLRELAFLNKGLSIRLTDLRTRNVDEITGQDTLKDETFCFLGGISEYVQFLNTTEDVASKIFYVEKKVDEVNVEVAFQYTDREDERCLCYANNAYNPGGGTHHTGFRVALTRVLNAYGNKENMFKNVTPIGEDYREGITAVLNIQVPEPQFESQTKIRLNNPEVEGIVASVLYEYMNTYLEENPKEALKIMKKVLLAAEAREAATKAKRALKERKSILSSGGLPGKLMDCTTRDRDESEIFLVEGGSAAGSADNGRDRNVQAILPLRGKVLNVEKARIEKLLDNEELCNLIAVIGVDIGNSEDTTKRRYGKIILLTDADVDGQHIRTLLLTFFFRQMRKLIEEGHIYVARPPLFKVDQKKSIRYVQTMNEMSTELLERGIEGTFLKVMPTTGQSTEPLLFEKDQLKGLVHLLDELERSLQILERRGHNVATLIGRIKDGKLPTFRVQLGKRELWLMKSEEVDAFRQEQLDKGKILHVPEEASTETNGEVFDARELHEVHDVNRCLEKLRTYHLDATDLIPQPRIAGREPAARFFLEEKVLDHLRDLVANVRKLGERGMKVTRFKGLGEMDGEELWDTTLDPTRRTLLKVLLEDADEADRMFRILMGEKVEPRREYIESHARDVKEIDYHGA